MSETKANVARPKKEDEPEKVTTEEATLVESTADSELATPWTTGRSADIEESDLILPRLQIVAKVGPLSEVNAPCTILLDGEARLTDPSADPPRVDPVSLTVLAWNKSYVEHIDYNANGDRKVPEVLYTEQEVYDRKGTLDWADDGEGGKLRPTWNRTLNLQLLVEKPDSMEDTAHFPFEFDGKLYALACWTVTRSAYTRAAKKFFTAFHHQLKKNNAGGTFRLTTHVADIAGNKVVVPEVRYGPRNTEEFLKWVEEMRP
jgi:hypothetical protein